MPDPGRQAAGRRGKATGAAFERMLEASCELYWREGAARIEKTPEPFRVTGSEGGGTFRGHFERKGQPDFKGILRDGSCIMFEAKHTDSGRIRQGAVTPWQWEGLDAYESMGARCFVMVSLGLRDFYRVPWGDWKRMGEAHGHRHMAEGELEPYRVPVGRGAILILEGLELSGGRP